MKIVDIISLLLTLTLFLQAQVYEAQQHSSAAVISRFCQLDTSGRRLTAAGAKEMARRLMFTEGARAESAQVIVIGSFSVRSESIAAATAEFVIDYQVLGRLDSSSDLPAFTRRIVISRSCGLNTLLWF